MRGAVSQENSYTAKTAEQAIAYSKKIIMRNLKMRKQFHVPENCQQNRRTRVFHDKIISEVSRKLTINFVSCSMGGKAAFRGRSAVV